MKKLLLSIFIALLAATTGWAERDFSKTVIKTTHVANSVYMIEGEGGNIAVSVGDDGILMIDDQFAELNKKIIQAIKKLSPNPVEFLLNTHWHGDHTGGNELMYEKGAHIVAHENVRKRLSSKQVRKSSGKVNEARPKEALPVLTYTDALTFYFNEEEVEVVHLGEGHTDGDSIIFFKNANVVHMGDNMFSGRFPFIDLDSGGDVDGYLQNVESILAIIDDKTKIIPGHGPLSTKKDLTQFRDMLSYFTGIIDSAVKDAKTFEDIQKIKFDEQYQDWGSGFISQDRWLETLFTFYSQN